MVSNICSDFKEVVLHFTEAMPASEEKSNGLIYARARHTHDAHNHAIHTHAVHAHAVHVHAVHAHAVHAHAVHTHVMPGLSLRVHAAQS